MEGVIIGMYNFLLPTHNFNSTQSHTWIDAK